MDKFSENEVFKKNIYLNKAKNILFLTIPFFILSFITYIIPNLFNIFDFGLIFELLSFILLLIALHFINKSNIYYSKRFIIFSIFSIGWLLVYDLINLFVNFSFHAIIFFDKLLIIIIFLQSKIYKNLCKANNENEFEEPTDWFYDKK